MIFAQTNAPVSSITGVDTIDQWLNASPIVLVFVAIQTVLFGLKKTEWFQDKYIPMASVVLGVACYPWMVGGWSPKNIIIGVLAGAGSTGINQAIRQLRGYYDEPKTPQPPTPPAPNP